MADLDFPASPSNGDIYEPNNENNARYQYDSTKAVWFGVAKSNQHPVGIIIQTMTSSNPGDADQLGYGTWVRIPEGRILIGVGGGWTNGEKQGTERHTLTIAQMASHTHGLRRTTRDSGSGSSDRVSGSGTGNFTNFTGGGGSHNNLMPVIGVYMWNRTV